MRVIIDIRDVPATTAIECVRQVVAEGPVHNNDYCALTTFKTPQGEVAVIRRDYRKNHCFIVTKRLCPLQDTTNRSTYDKAR